jgi:endogenous inhibitor of DNA gyrase (YacG/DUF329 family)
MKCPVCKKVEVALGAAEFPFCSDRCRTIDLGNWASGKYVISTPLPPGGADEDSVIESDEDD